MIRVSIFTRMMFKDALVKSLWTTLFFLLFHIFYNIEIVRDKVEDVAFDMVNKFYIYPANRDVKSAPIMLFAFDDYYMVEESLFDEDNISNYGYTLPRDHIANFIERLDEELSTEDYAHTSPKALFIDYDMSFSAMPYGKDLASQDKALLEILKRPRDYAILLPKTQKTNFIESSQDPAIQKAIEAKRIVFVSVALLKSKDDALRRYRSEQSFGIKHPSSSYLNVDVALWQYMRNRSSHPFMLDDIVGNRIFLKGYTHEALDEGCRISYSSWKPLRKFSAHCSIFENIEPSELNNSIILLGGTHTQNSDKFTILDVWGKQEMSGIEVHANALLTMLYLDHPLKRLPLMLSIVIVFALFFVLHFLSRMLLHYLRLKDITLSFILSVVLSTLFFYALSLALLHYYKLWFNWLVPWVVFQLMRLFQFLSKKSSDANVKVAKFTSIISLLRR